MRLIAPQSFFGIPIACIGISSLLLSAIFASCSSGTTSSPSAPATTGATNKPNTAKEKNATIIASSPASTTSSITTTDNPASDVSGQAPGQDPGTQNIVTAPASNTTKISGAVSRAISYRNTGKGTLCVAIGIGCLSLSTYQTYKGVLSVSLPNVDLTANGAQGAFSFDVAPGKLVSGTRYAIIAMLEETGGQCWINWTKNNLFTWESDSNNTPCASFTYQEGTPISGLGVALNGLVPIDYVVNTQ